MGEAGGLREPRRRRGSCGGGRGSGSGSAGRMEQEEILRKFIQRVQAMKDTDHNGDDNFASDFMVRGLGALSSHRCLGAGERVPCGLGRRSGRRGDGWGVYGVGGGEHPPA